MNEPPRAVYSRPASLIRTAAPLLLSHRGALGDFLVSWPAIRALALAREVRPHAPRGSARTDEPEGPCPPLLWAGRPDYLFFLEPLGIRRAGPELLRAVDRLYGGDADALPPGAGLVRFALKPGGSFPEHPRVVSIYSMGEEGFDPPGMRQAKALAGLGIAPGAAAKAKREPEEKIEKIPTSTSAGSFPGERGGTRGERGGTRGERGGTRGDPAEGGPGGPAEEAPGKPAEWLPGSLAAFREVFAGVDAGPEEARVLDLPPAPPDASAGQKGPVAPKKPRATTPDLPQTPGLALLFPGAGHPAKAWPPVQFFELARRLPELRLAPVFVLGPAEVDRGMQVSGFPQVRPASLPELTGLLNRAALVLGNDSGPLHLAGMLGRPAVALFGPSSRRQWGPPGVLALARDLPCRPCTRTTAGLNCPDPVCLSGLDADTVLAAARQVLAQTASP